MRAEPATLGRRTALKASSALGSEGQWHLVAPPSGVERFSPTLVYDPIRQRLLSFGGADSVYRNDTWSFSLSTGRWTQLATPGTRPPARRFHGAIYDPNGDRMIIHGGWADGVLSDTWQLSLAGTPTWTPIAESSLPGPRAAFSAVYDAANARMVVFGGYDGTSDDYDGSSSSFGRRNDVWALSLGGSPTWSPLTPSGTPPSPRLGMSSGYAPESGSMLVFGGSDSSYSNELWQLTLGASPAWSLVATTAPGPAPRVFQAGGYDPVSHQFIVFGGYDAIFVYGDVWRIAPGASSPQWQDVTPDPTITPRWGPGSAVTSAGDFFVSGGVSAYGRLLADVWKLNVANPVAWQRYEDLYPPRLQEVMILDPVRHRLLAFGGTDGWYRNDTYVHPLDFGRGWAPLSTAGTPPSPRRLHTGIHDPDGDRLIVFGGYDDTLLGDLWQLTLSGTPTWSPLAASGGGPSPRGGHVAIHDPIGQRMIVFGGWVGSSSPTYRIADTWALSLTGAPTWTLLDAGSGPSTRSSASAVYDAATQSMIVFGGTDPGYRNDAWSFSLSGAPSWTQISPTGGLPGAREEQAAVYDSHRDRMVIFGGYDSSVRNYGDLWSLDMANTPAWEPLAATGDWPSARWGMKALYDPALDGMWMYGGWDYAYSQQLWFLQWADPSAPAMIATTQADALPNRANFQWQLPSRARTTTTIQRSTDGVAWRTVGDLIPQGTVVSFTDRAVAPGNQYAWRSLVTTGGTTMMSAATWLTIPGTTGVNSADPGFGLSLAGRSTIPGSVAVLCTLPRESAGRVQLLDLAGRVLDTREVPAGVGVEQRIELGRGLDAGMFFVRFVSGTRVATLKSIVLR